MGILNLVNLKPSTTYNVYVVSQSGDGSESPASEILTFTTPADIQTVVNKTNTIQLGGGAIFAGSITGPGVLFNQDGLKGIKSGGASSFFIDANTGDAYFAGSVVANAGQIGGFRIGPTSLSATNIVIDSGLGLNFGPNKFIVDNLGNASVSGNIIAQSGSFTGALSASVGTIGGWTLGSTALSSNTVYINSQYGYIEAGTSPNSVVMNKTTGFYAGGGRDGGGNPTSTTPFWVTIDGNLRATNASISGNIVANSGSFLGAITASVGRIGGFTLQSNSLSATNVVLSSTVGLNLGNGIFSVDQNGNLIAQSASISGSISAQSGQIGGFSIKSNSLSAQNIVLASDTGLNLGNGAFSVSQAGALKATSASISGDIVAKSGSITGVLAISPSGSIIAGDLTTNYVSIGGVGVQGVQGGLTTFYLPTDGTAPIIGGFKVLQTGLVTVGEVTGKTISGTKGATTITVSPDNTNLFIGMAVEDYPGYTLVPSGTVITQINGTTISLSTATLGSGTFSGYSIKFVPNGNLIIGTDTSNGIIIRGSTVGALTPAIFTRISGTATTDSAGNGFYIGQDGKFRLAGTNGYISMDGSGNLFVSGTINAASGNFTGTLTSSVGTIGGWTLGSTALSSDTVYINSQYGYISTGTSTSGVVMSKGYGFYAGGNRDVNGLPTATTPFWADLDGNLRATNASIAGNIVATSGSFAGNISASTGLIGNWSISSSGLYNGSVGFFASSTYNAGEIAIFAGSAMQNRATAPFRVDYNGNLVAQNANIAGTITSSAGSIGNWAISSSGMYNGSVGFFASAVYNSNEIAIFAGSAINNRNTAPFKVTYSGNLVAQNASISGNITSSAGNIAGFNLFNTNLYSTASTVSTNLGATALPYLGLSTTGNFANQSFVIPPGTYTTGGEYSSASGGTIILSASSNSGSDRNLIIDPYGLSWFVGLGQYYLNYKRLVYDGVINQFSILGSDGTNPPGTTTLRIGGLNGTSFNSQQYGGLSIVTASSTAAPVSFRPYSTAGTSIATSDLYYNQSASAWIDKTNFYVGATNSIRNAVNAGFTTGTNGSTNIMSNNIPLNLNIPQSAGGANNNQYMQFYVNGTSTAAISMSSSAASTNFIITSTGSITLQSTNNATYLSDLVSQTTTNAANINTASNNNGLIARVTGSSRSFKNSIGDLANNLSASQILNIQVRQFKFNNDYLNQSDSRYDTFVPGFIIEELIDVAPIIVDVNSDGNLENWNPRFLIPLMLKLIQEQNSKLTQLEQRIADLENK